MNKLQEENRGLERKLVMDVETWFDRTFNMIQLKIFEKVTDNCLFEYIDDVDPDYDDFINNYSLYKEYADYILEKEENDEEYSKELFSEDHQNFDSYMDDRRGENYPMWNTLFELKYEHGNYLNEAAKAVGLGVISGVDGFNNTFFAMSAGHSFMSAYWIPMYLHWNDTARKKYKDVKYDHL